MNIDDVVPEYFRESFKAYSKLETEEEIALFWKEEKKKNIDPEVHKREYLKGLQLLRKAVEDLGKKVSAAVEA